MAGITLFVFELQGGQTAILPVAETGGNGDHLGVDAFGDIGLGDQMTHGALNAHQITGFDAHFCGCFRIHPGRVAVRDFRQPLHCSRARLLHHVELVGGQYQLVVLHGFMPRDALERGHRVEAIFGPLVDANVDDAVAGGETNIVLAIAFDTNGLATLADSP